MLDIAEDMVLAERKQENLVAKVLVKALRDLQKGKLPNGQACPMMTLEKPVTSVANARSFDQLVSWQKEVAKKLESFDEKNFRNSSKKTAVVCITDPHCQNENYPALLDHVHTQSKNNEEVIVAINGDIFTKYQAHDTSVSGHTSVQASAEDSHVDRCIVFITCLKTMLKNRNVRIILNIGNHEVHDSKDGGSHAHRAACLFAIMKKAYGERFQIVSNLVAVEPNYPAWGYLQKKEAYKTYKPFYQYEPRNGFCNYVRPSAELEGISFAGYCTQCVYKDKPGNYTYAREKHPFFDKGGLSGHEARLRVRVQEKDKAGYIPFVMAHEGIANLQNLWSSHAWEFQGERYLQAGHYVSDWNDYIHKHKDYSVPGFDKEHVILEKHQLYSVGTVTFPPYSSKGTVTSTNLTTKVIGAASGGKKRTHR
ncbi:hypothetical protein AGMMS49949_00790 [Alphaproteobacteria bacterium]|nr:hypothetical protein AGMMS49949_00790 [Alphaproteobacteria bacterium]GHS95798.1 hypothetical protein AGMMS50296_0960 [Alphaproteobacteria bacterium]